MLYVKPVPDVDILFTFVTVYLSVFLSFSYCLPVSGEIKLYILACPAKFGDRKCRSSPSNGAATVIPKFTV